MLSPQSAVVPLLIISLIVQSADCFTIRCKVCKVETEMGRRLWNLYRHCRPHSLRGLEEGAWLKPSSSFSVYGAFQIKANQNIVTLLLCVCVGVLQSSVSHDPSEIILICQFGNIVEIKKMYYYYYEQCREELLFKVIC